MKAKNIKGMKRNIVYSFATPYDPKGQILYVNVIPRYGCTNSCRFCDRHSAIQKKPNIYERKAGTSLFLPRAPLVEEMMQELGTKRTKDTTEIAFVGLGEPLLQFDLVAETMQRLRNYGYSGKLRIDTNGQVGCWRVGDPAKELKAAGLDEIRISVNETNPKDYTGLCKPRRKNAFERVCRFVRQCLSVGIETHTSFVVGFDDRKVRTKYPKEYVEFAMSLGVERKNIIIREYVSRLA